MDAVLDQSLKLACLIRDSAEANTWRQAWNSFLNIPLNTPNIMELPLQQIPFAEHAKHLRQSEQAQARPLVFPLLLAQFPFNLSGSQVRERLRIIQKSGTHISV